MLSVVIPTHNAERWIPRLLRSLDPEPDWEVIVVDDGSSDRTAEFAQNWLDRRKRGLLVRLPHMGPGRARQTGLDLATQPFVTFADADDEVRSDTLAKGVRDIANDGDVFISSFELRPTAKKARRDLTPTTRRVSSGRVLTARAAIWGKIYRLEFLRTNAITFPDVVSADDVVFSWRVASACPRVFETTAVGYYYWVDPHGQLTRTSEYFREGLVRMSELWNESLGRGVRVRALASYAYFSGCWHILRKTRGRERPKVLWSTAKGLRGRLSE